MVSELSWQCKCCGEKFMKGIVLLLWMSSYIAINLLGSVNPLAFITFPPLVSDWGHLRPEGTWSLFLFPLFFFGNSSPCIYMFNFAFPFVAITHPRLNNVLLERVHQARCFPDGSFHSLTTLHRLARLGLSPKPFEEALSYETTTRRSKFPFHCIILHYFCFINPF